MDHEKLINEFLNSESNFIPLFSMEDEEILKKEELPEVLPILPLRNTVLFPGIIIPITVGRHTHKYIISISGKSNSHAARLFFSFCTLLIL